MKFFTERQGMRMPVQRTDLITVEMYSDILRCCENYYQYLSHIFPEQCPDGNACYGLNLEAFEIRIKFEIPSLFINPYNNKISPPDFNFRSEDNFNQYALLDLVEYIAQNCRDISLDNIPHLFFNHNHITFLKTNNIFGEYRKEINHIFETTGLLFTLTDNKTVDRIICNPVLSSEIEGVARNIAEKGTQELLEEAIFLFKKREPSFRKNAVEKIWDAFERLKTYHKELKKKDSAEKIVNAMGGEQSKFRDLLNDEFTLLTNVGNNFTIRHHEICKTDITDTKHYDYLFNRCLSLISLAVEYLPSNTNHKLDAVEDELPF